VYLEKNLDRTVRLAELGRLAGLSPFTVQRLFKREMGVSPFKYQRALRARRLRAALKKGEAVTDAIYTAGFSSSSRAYEGSQLGMTPTRFAQGGKGERIAWCSAPSPFGWVVVGGTERGLCWLSLAATKAKAEASLREEFPAAELKRDPALLRWVEMAVESVSPGTAFVQNQTHAERLDLRGTVFQLRVWQALRQNSARRDADVWPVGARDGRSQGDAGGGAGLRFESRFAGGAVSSRGGRRRLAHRLPLGRGAQTEIA